jgi:hypothetical protein
MLCSVFHVVHFRPGARRERQALRRTLSHWTFTLGSSPDGFDQNPSKTGSCPGKGEIWPFEGRQNALKRAIFGCRDNNCPRRRGQARAAVEAADQRFSARAYPRRLPESRLAGHPSSGGTTRTDLRWMRPPHDRLHGAGQKRALRNKRACSPLEAHARVGRWHEHSGRGLVRLLLSASQ